MPAWDDHCWLVSDAARPWLERADFEARGLVSQARRLRSDLGPARTRLVLELVALRRRAAVKFSHADQMFFTRQLLEQATDERIAAYKAGRYPLAQPLADLCCGIGGDLLGLATQGPVTGVDRDPVSVLYASANCQACGMANVTVREADVSGYDITNCGAWHLDPDRRAVGRRTTRVEFQEPGMETIDRLLRSNGQGAIKLAPTTDVPPEWAATAESEWIESRGECRQQVLWFGMLASTPGQRTATILQGSDGRPQSLRGHPDIEIPLAPTVGRIVFEPSAAVIAARLTGVVASQERLAAFAPGISYLTADAVVEHPLLTAFEVTDLLPFDWKRLKALLRQRGIGRLEVKKRGVPILPEEVLKRVTPRGEHSATLLLFARGRSVQAILARRIHPQYNLRS
jgi:hypothetical protein